MLPMMDVVDPAETQMYIPLVLDEMNGVQTGGASQGEASIPSQIDKSTPSISLSKADEITTGYVLPFLPR